MSRIWNKRKIEKTQVIISIFFRKYVKHSKLDRTEGIFVDDIKDRLSSADEVTVLYIISGFDYTHRSFSTEADLRQKRQTYNRYPYIRILKVYPDDLHSETETFEYVSWIILININYAYKHIYACIFVDENHACVEFN